MVIGTITAYAAIAELPLEHRDPDRASACCMGVSSTVDLDAVRQRAAAVPDLADKAVRAFNIVMALLLLASLYPVFMDA